MASVVGTSGSGCAAADGRCWERFAALVVDSTLVYLGLSILEEALSRAEVYLPFELSFAIAAASYATACIAWKGRTIGKALCGLVVQTTDGARPGFARALVRETVAKCLSAIPLLLGFLWAGLGRERRAWHDSLSDTRVVRGPGSRARALATVSASIVAFGLLTAVHAWRIADLYLDARSMAPAPLPAVVGRSPSALVEASSIGESEDGPYVAWLDLHAKAPVDYAVDKSIEHRVVIFGETHWKKEPLQFLNDLIPRLYEDAGVTCVAMEACLAEDNAAIERLVTGRDYDDELAMEIARHHSLGRWGWKGYWDVFETVWRLNRSIPAGEPKVRVVGLDLPIDLPSVALAGIGDAAIDGGLPERLRFVRVAYQLPRMLLRDAFMAWQVEHEILRRGERGIVWVGSAHASVHCPNPGPTGSAWGRMGFMLRQKHGAAVFQIRVHDVDLPVTLSDPAYRGPAPGMATLIERIMARRSHVAAAFDSAGSPFELLRDRGSWDYHFDPCLSLGSVAAGYLYLAPGASLTRCDWLPGYITAEMFVADEPYYRALAQRLGKDVRSAEEADRLWYRP